MQVFKIFVDLDKEEEYLRDMAEKGYRLGGYSYFGIYTFKSAEPKSLNYRVDYRYFSRKAQFEEYVTLFDDAGWEHIYGTPFSGSQYFLPKPDVKQTEDIFSDRVSKADKYKRLSKICLLSACALLAVLFVDVLMDMEGRGWSAFDFHSLYLTPGLWERAGQDFLKAFLFETPFAVLRAIMKTVPTIILAFITILYGYWAFKAWKLYKQRR
jgi:hypothetical protein